MENVSTSRCFEVGRGSGWSCTGSRGGKKRIGGRYFAVLRHPGADQVERMFRLKDFKWMFKVQKHENIDMKQIKMGKREFRSPNCPVKICENERCWKGWMECSRATCRAWWGRCNDVPMCHGLTWPSYFLAGATNTLCVSQEVRGVRGFMELNFIDCLLFHRVPIRLVCRPLSDKPTQAFRNTGLYS